MLALDASRPYIASGLRWRRVPSLCHPFVGVAGGPMPLRTLKLQDIDPCPDSAQAFGFKVRSGCTKDGDGSETGMGCGQSTGRARSRYAWWAAH